MQKLKVNNVNLGMDFPLSKEIITDLKKKQMLLRLIEKEKNQLLLL